MPNAKRTAFMVALAALALLATGTVLYAQSGLPNPYRPVRGLADGNGPEFVAVDKHGNVFGYRVSLMS